jgi:hypothetical protein
MTQNLSKATSMMVREDMNTEVLGSVLINLREQRQRMSPGLLHGMYKTAVSEGNIKKGPNKRNI